MYHIHLLNVNLWVLNMNRLVTYSDVGNQRLIQKGEKRIKLVCKSIWTSSGNIISSCTGEGWLVNVRTMTVRILLAKHELFQSYITHYTVRGDNRWRRITVLQSLTCIRNPYATLA